ncbi:MAG: hypothetical protein IPP66_05965 [Anaerolineales bacterium]|nr:hypothetical protein [Anaerolineales bacterium]
MNRSVSINMSPLLQKAAVKRGLIFGGIILTALLAFEAFNFSSTSFALHDVLGDLSFGPFKWATILAFAFCGIDFAGIARIFTPEQGRNEPAEVWYLLGAWFLAAAFNASLTWWGVSVAIMKHSAEGGVLLGQATMTKVVPIIVAVMVLAIRVLLINTFSVAGDRIFSMADERQTQYQNKPAYNKPAYTPNNDAYRNPTPSFPRPAPKPVAAAPARPTYNEPTYHPIGMNAQGQGQNNNRNNTYMS